MLGVAIGSREGGPFTEAIKSVLIVDSNEKHTRTFSLSLSLSLSPSHQHCMHKEKIAVSSGRDVQKIIFRK